MDHRVHSDDRVIAGVVRVSFPCKPYREKKDTIGGPTVSLSGTTSQVYKSVFNCNA